MAAYEKKIKQIGLQRKQIANIKHLAIPEIDTLRFINWPSARAGRADLSKPAASYQQQRDELLAVLS